MKIINLTQHAATPDQVEAGVVDLDPADRAGLQNLLTFETLPSREGIEQRAGLLAVLARDVGADAAMIGGAPWLMGPLAAKLRQVGVVPLFAFSTRESADQAQPDGTVRKVSVFRHRGFVEAL